ncbi:hypothetical protein KC963_05520, partial [Candidatus Saccharibacteria bacterium]|nr:hypothetical protein [Candidatus Saccharibacteria bacterium]
ITSPDLLPQWSGVTIRLVANGTGVLVHEWDRLAEQVLEKLKASRAIASVQARWQEVKSLLGQIDIAKYPEYGLSPIEAIDNGGSDSLFAKLRAARVAAYGPNGGHPQPSAALRALVKLEERINEALAVFAEKQKQELLARQQACHRLAMLEALLASDEYVFHPFDSDFLYIHPGDVLPIDEMWIDDLLIRGGHKDVELIVTYIGDNVWVRLVALYNDQESRHKEIVLLVDNQLDIPDLSEVVTIHTWKPVDEQTVQNYQELVRIQDLLLQTTREQDLFASGTSNRLQLTFCLEPAPKEGRLRWVHRDAQRDSLLRVYLIETVSRILPTREGENWICVVNRRLSTSKVQQVYTVNLLVRVDPEYLKELAVTEASLRKELRM